jgi:hypothetical protein
MKVAGRAVAVVVLSLAVALAPREGGAAPPLRASIEVDAAALGDESESVSRTVADEGEVALRNADVLPARSEKDGTIHVQLAPGYRFVAWADRADAEVEGTRIEGECMACSDRDLAQKVAEAITAMVDPLRATASEEEPAPQTVAAPKATQPVGRVRIGAFGIGGIVLMAVGVGALGGGAAMLARGRDVSPDPSDPSQLEGLDYRPGGGALFAVGVAAVITGAVMLYVGVKKGKEARNRRAALRPAAGGVSVAF